MNVATILKEKGGDVFTAESAAPLKVIAEALARRRIGCIVIVDKKERVAGIVSERDVVRLIAERGADALDEPVSECMTKKVITCTETDSIETLMAEMTKGRFRHLPVVDGERLVGLISIGDVVKQRIAEAEMEAAAMRDYIATG